MTRNVDQNTRPSFCFLGEGSGDETSPQGGGGGGVPQNEAQAYLAVKVGNVAHILSAPGEYSEALASSLSQRGMQVSSFTEL